MALRCCIAPNAKFCFVHSVGARGTKLHDELDALCACSSRSSQALTASAFGKYPAISGESKSQSATDVGAMRAGCREK